MVSTVKTICQEACHEGKLSPFELARRDPDHTPRWCCQYAWRKRSAIL